MEHRIDHHILKQNFLVRVVLVLNVVNAVIGIGFLMLIVGEKIRSFM
jgi:hypothetical protein